MENTIPVPNGLLEKLRIARTQYKEATKLFVAGENISKRLK